MNMEAQAMQSSQNEGEEKQANFEANSARAAAIQREIAAAAASGDFARIGELSAEGAKLQSENEGVEGADRLEAMEMNAEFDAEKARAEEEAEKKVVEEAAAEQAKLIEDAENDLERSKAKADEIVANLKRQEASEEEKIEMDMTFSEAEREGKEGWDGERAKQSIEAEREFLAANQASLKEELGEEAMQKIIAGFKERKFGIDKLGNRYLPDKGIHAQIAEERRNIQHAKDMEGAEAEIRVAKSEQIASKEKANDRREAQRAEWDPTVQMEQEQAASDAAAEIARGWEGEKATAALEAERQYLVENQATLKEELGLDRWKEVTDGFKKRKEQVQSGGKYFLNEGAVAQIEKMRQGL